MAKDLKNNRICGAMAGVKALHYVDVKDVNGVIRTEAGVEVALRQGEYWRVIEFNSANVSTTETEGAYSHVIEVKTGARSLTRRLAQSAMRGRFIVRVKRNDGEIEIYGDKEEPMRIAIEGYNDGTAGGETGYRIWITGVTEFF